MSRMPVVVFSCVCASTPGDTRTSTRALTPAAAAAAATCAISPALSITMRPTPASTASRSSTGDLLLPVEIDAPHVDAGHSQDGDLAAGDGVEAQPLCGDQARERAVEERLGAVQNVCLGVLGSEAVDIGAALRTNRRHIVDIKRRLRTRERVRARRSRRWSGVRRVTALPKAAIREQAAASVPRTSSQVRAPRAAECSLRGVAPALSAAHRRCADYDTPPARAASAVGARSLPGAHAPTLGFVGAGAPTPPSAGVRTTALGPAS